MKVLVIGSGAREHAIAHALLRGGSVEQVTVAPGNPGMEKDGIKTTRLSESNHAALIDFVKDNGYDWVFVGPEVPLIEGIVDDFQAAGIPAFGPSKAAAQIEGSKDFAKRLMERHGIPTAAYRTFEDLASAKAYVAEHGAPIVIKADGLAAGKGVTVAMDVETADAALEDIFVDHRFGSAGAKVVVEDFLEGQEFSLMSFVNGTDFWPMPISQDHKRAYDGDKGPNTGGMGAYSPVPQIGEDVVRAAVDTIVRPTVEAMAEEGTPFTGILYAGLIATADGPKVIEFNARFGDPETEVVLPRLTSDLGAGIKAILDGGTPDFTWAADGATLGVVLASDGYPTDVVKGAHVPDIPVDDDAHVYYAGVAAGQEPGELVASSGRVLFVEVSAPTIKAAQDKVYGILDGLDVTGMFYRHDIGAKALAASGGEA
ncbi:phosphoribosylamine--glycine ligase [Bifidobacterium pullorum subsp. saeculare]|uniref:Phosphoribosylamine--glycine ligase n=1 Tax=Bifidobacterium pullorum subsp. saeculare TaxID=78257 RepID=A0A938WW19_9BIFI|nr:phosphoribosylamine--glycine ligase [Bifidobacterium pullorum]MBM6698891.1 phosphoribosylamine--glycine ligase [Bifidobacterium pullorum subsp. saeculare]